MEEFLQRICEAKIDFSRCPACAADGTASYILQFEFEPELMFQDLDAAVEATYALSDFFKSYGYNNAVGSFGFDYNSDNNVILSNLEVNFMTPEERDIALEFIEDYIEAQSCDVSDNISSCDKSLLGKLAQQVESLKIVSPEGLKELISDYNSIHDDDVELAGYTDRNRTVLHHVNCDRKEIVIEK